MKKQLVVISLASALALAGCESTPEQPKLQETVNYSSVKYQGQPGQVDYSVNGQPQQRYLLETNSLQNVHQNAAPAAGSQQAFASESETEKQPAPAPKANKRPETISQVDERISAEQAAPQAEQPKTIVLKQQPRQEKIKITGVGYGAESTYEGFTDGQRRLMAIRASKLDAYRSLAEQLYGIKIDSNTSVSTLTAQSDSFRARVNAVVKGARIVSITPMSDNNYETVLEVFVDRRFFEDVFVYTGNQHDRVLEPVETCSMGFNCYEAANYR